MFAEHVVKCWPAYFDAMEAGIKPFEIRRDDRGYQRGDMLILEKWCPRNGYVLNGTPLQRVTLRRRITYVLTGGQFGIEPGYVVLGLAELKQERTPAPPDRHASGSPGPVNCSTRLRIQGKPYPRTCERCGLGPCPFFDKDGTSRRGAR